MLLLYYKLKALLHDPLKAQAIIQARLVLTDDTLVGDQDVAASSNYPASANFVCRL